MTNAITVLNQIADKAVLYVNGYKEGYTQLYLYAKGRGTRIIPLSAPKITISDLVEGTYYLSCADAEGNETGYTTLHVSSISYRDFMDNVLTVVNVTDEASIELVSELSDIDYVTELYRKAYAKGIEAYEETVTAFIDLFNTREETLNTFTVPEFMVRGGEIRSTGNKIFQCIVYVYDIARQTWKLVPGQSREQSGHYTFFGKHSEMYRICVLSENELVREYFYYQTSKTLSETILGRRIERTHNLDEKTALLVSKFDLTDLADDTYGQHVVGAIQEMNPIAPVMSMPHVEFNAENNIFYVTVPDFERTRFGETDLYIGALEIEEAFSPKKVPHKKPILTASFQMEPLWYHFNWGEDYLFYLCYADGTPVSQCVVCGYGSESKLDTYFAVSRKIDLELYRRRLFALYKEYDKADWPLVSSMLDQYLNSDENLYTSITEYLLVALSNLEAVRYRIDYLMELVLLNQLMYYTPVDQSFVHQQVYMPAYRKHVMPEAEKHIICCARLDDHTLSWEYLEGGPEAKEIRIDKDQYTWLFALSTDFSRTSAFAFYHNIYIGEPQGFYFPHLEVTTIHGL